MLLPVAVSGIGAVVLTAYLAHREILRVDLGLLILASWGVAIAFAWLVRAIAEGLPYSIEPPIRRSDGTQRCIVSQGEVVMEDHQQGLKLCGTVLDITDRKRLEASLRAQAEEERLLTTLTQNIRQSLDLDEILATTVNQVQQSLNADQVLIFRVHPDGSAQVIQSSVAEYFVSQPGHRVRAGYLQAYPATTWR